MLQIWRYGYSRDLNIVICVGFSTLLFYAINMDAVSLFTDSSFLFLANFHCIDATYQFEWMNIIYFCKKKTSKLITEANVYWSLFIFFVWYVLIFGSYVNWIIHELIGESIRLIEFQKIKIWVDSYNHMMKLSVLVYDSSVQINYETIVFCFSRRIRIGSLRVQR